MLAETTRLIYLHGFASSPASRKASYFGQRLAECGHSLEAPDLAEGNFEGLTLSSQLDLLARLWGNDAVTLIGSSLGGYLAALAAARHTQVKRLLLLAPAFGFLQLWKSHLGPARMEHWRNTGQLSVYHYGEQRDRSLGFQLMVDAEHYPAYPDFAQPALIFHGRQDDTVPLSGSLKFASTHPNATVVPLESDHELTGVLDEIWQSSQTFLTHGIGGASLENRC